MKEQFEVAMSVTFSLNSPTQKPNASAFLWNAHMILNINCAGYANAQFMQPEPSKYSFSPSLEAKTFMQPEHPYFAHHPGRFFYLKNEKTGEIFSIPFAPCKKKLHRFEFIAHANKISWQIEHAGLVVSLSVCLAEQKPLEKWQLSIHRNTSDVSEQWSIYAYFPLGYMSWMNQSADFDWQHDAIVGTYVTPYQKIEEYPSLKNTAQKTFLCADKRPDAWCANQQAFEGIGGLSKPDALMAVKLPTTAAIYELPCAALQHRVALKLDEPQTLCYLFGPIHANQDIQSLKEKYLTSDFHTVTQQSFGNFKVSTPDKEFDDFINQWLPRQVVYHGEVNRLSTDPQTRNYLQDNIGNCFINPQKTKQSLRTALAQQYASGQMPDGILLHPDAELKYINQIPHSDHCVWLPILLESYCKQTNDAGFLQELIAFKDNENKSSVAQHIEKALLFLLTKRDTRGLCFIEQGDWCDPMNMVGAKGRGVSTWLTTATMYAIKVWLNIKRHYLTQLDCTAHCLVSDDYWQRQLADLQHSINTYCWDANWYSRGITDDGESFGIVSDNEGKIYLNPQSWAMLAGCADYTKTQKILHSVAQYLQTPFGNMMLAPSYTQMDERIGRLTQKHVGCAENGSVYNHAFIFWIFALYESGFDQRAFMGIKEMLGACGSNQSGQLPIYVPNYFRGAYYQTPEMSGKSSHLFNTGTAAWLYRIVIEKVFGLQGHADQLLISPNIPHEWTDVHVVYKFREATINLTIARADVVEPSLSVNNIKTDSMALGNIQAGKHYDLVAQLPFAVALKKPTLTLVCGVSGSGKTTLGETLAEKTKAIFLDADDLHSSQAKSNMSRGIALTDEERQPWLDRLVANTSQKLKHNHSVVLSFSGLKSMHRARLKTECGEHADSVKIVFLQAEQALIKQRLSQRRNHFFAENLLHSQFSALQPPAEHEAICLDASLSIDSLCELAFEALTSN